MFRLTKPRRVRAQWSAAMVLAAAAGFGAAALVGVAVAKTYTLQVAKNAKVGNKRENIVVTSRGFAVYTLTGDSKQHPKCTKANGCFQFWPPVTVASAKQLSKAPGVPGKLGVWQRNGFLQVTLGGRPVYRFAPDTQKGVAGGEGIKSFGGTWHVVKASNAGGTRSTTTMTSTTSPTTTTRPCAYPPYCY